MLQQKYMVPLGKNGDRLSRLANRSLARAMDGQSEYRELTARKTYRKNRVSIVDGERLAELKVVLRAGLRHLAVDLRIAGCLDKQERSMYPLHIGIRSLLFSQLVPLNDFLE
jgi:hypothetical protein